MLWFNSNYYADNVHEHLITKLKELRNLTNKI